MKEIVDEMVAAVDDGDGVIDYEKFVKMIQKYYSRSNVIWLYI